MLLLANRVSAFGTIPASAAAGLCASTLTPFASHFVGPPATSAGAVGLWHQRPAAFNHSVRKTTGGKPSPKPQPGSLHLHFIVRPVHKIPPKDGRQFKIVCPVHNLASRMDGNFRCLTGQRLFAAFARIGSQSDSGEKTLHRQILLCRRAYSASICLISTSLPRSRTVFSLPQRGQTLA